MKALGEDLISINLMFQPLKNNSSDLIKIIILAFIAYYSALVLFIFTSLNGVDRANSFLRLLEVFPTLVIAATAIYNVQTLIGTQRIGTSTKKIDRSLDYISRWNSATFPKQKVVYLLSKVRKNMDSKINDFNVVEFITKEIDGDAELRGEFFFALNFFEEMGMAVNFNSVDETFLKRFFQPIVKDYGIYFGTWIIDRQREKKERQERNGNSSKPDSSTDDRNNEVFVDIVELIDKWGHPMQAASTNTAVKRNEKKRGACHLLQRIIETLDLL